MSQLTSDEMPDPAAGLNDALLAFTGCIGESLPDICSYGLTFGDSYVPFDPDPEDECEDDEAMCSQTWVRVMSAGVVNITEGFEGDCAGTMQLILEVGILRCYSIPEGGEAPSASDVLLAATQAMSDMQTIYCAAMGCEVWASINVGSWTPIGPLGGQYGGTWQFTVEVA